MELDGTMGADEYVHVHVCVELSAARSEAAEGRNRS